MDQEINSNPENSGNNPPKKWVYTPPADHLAEKREMLFAVCILVSAMLLWNSICCGGFHLGFAIGSVLTIGCSVVYLIRSGHRFDWYSGTLIGFSILIAVGFGWSDDGFAKLVMLVFQITALNLGLCLAAKQNASGPNGVTSLFDAPRTLFGLGFGDLGKARRGLVEGVVYSSNAGKKAGAVAVGLVFSIPLVAVMVVLLTGADAAFEGLLNQFPEIRMKEILWTVLIGGFAGFIMYTRAVSLHRGPKPENKDPWIPKTSPLTVNTILAAVSLVYCVYLFSQLAYLSGGFAGILPEGYTLAAYARRGFFEMAVLCGINLLCISFSVGLVEKKGKTPGLTRGMCLFIGLITLFLVITSSAKMIMYIDGFGLTRLRVLTQVITVFLGITTIVVCVWLFLPKLPYMRVILLLALTMGTVTLWADVDSQVAKYNVSAYRSGRLETVDVDYLSRLGSGAIPYIEELIWDSDPKIALKACRILKGMTDECGDDWRGWCYLDSQAQDILDTLPFPSE